MENEARLAETSQVFQELETLKVAEKLLKENMKKLEQQLIDQAVEASGCFISFALSLLPCYEFNYVFVCITHGQIRNAHGTSKILEMTLYNQRKLCPSYSKIKKQCTA